MHIRLSAFIRGLLHTLGPLLRRITERLVGHPMNLLHRGGKVSQRAHVARLTDLLSLPVEVPHGQRIPQPFLGAAGGHERTHHTFHENPITMGLNEVHCPVDATLHITWFGTFGQVHEALDPLRPLVLQRQCHHLLLADAGGVSGLRDIAAERGIEHEHLIDIQIDTLRVSFDHWLACGVLDWAACCAAACFCAQNSARAFRRKPARPESLSRLSPGLMPEKSFASVRLAAGPLNEFTANSCPRARKSQAPPKAEQLVTAPPMLTGGGL